MSEAVRISFSKPAVKMEAACLCQRDDSDGVGVMGPDELLGVKILRWERNEEGVWGRQYFNLPPVAMPLKWLVILDREMSCLQGG